MTGGKATQAAAMQGATAASMLIVTVFVTTAVTTPARGADAPDEMQHAMPTMTGTLGVYGMTRDASGTSWQPDSSIHEGLHGMWGKWMGMAHAFINGVYDWQGGPRSGDKVFASGMIMGSLRHYSDTGDVLNFRAMLSPDPIMGKRGYPLIFASGETADGRTPLVDRQHPHDLFMELSTSYSHPLSEAASVFAYFGLPGEPAFGPPAFMHRASIMDSPEAPISHHWLDSTHVVFGVATSGVVYRNWKLEASRFTGREPDANRYDFDKPRFDSTSARLSWNPTRQLSLQTSWAHLHSPEQIHPEENETRWSASAIYTIAVGEIGQWSSTLAWGRKDISDGTTLDAWVLESALKPSRLWTFFTRLERIDEAELLTGIEPQTVGKTAFGLVRDIQITTHGFVGIGGQYAFNWPGTVLSSVYCGDPHGAMAFIRLKIQ